MFETQKSGNKTSSGKIDLNIRTLASPKVGQDQVSGVNVICWHAAPVANVLWKPEGRRMVPEVVIQLDWLFHNRTICEAPRLHL